MYTWEPARLLTIYPRQQTPQRTYIELDCTDGRLTADWDGEIGNAVPIDVYQGHTRRYSIPLFGQRTINALLDEIAPLAQRVLDGYDSEWDGSNNVATLSDDALAAESEIERIIQEYGDPDLHWVDAGDWLDDTSDEITRRLANGETVDALMEELDGDGTSEDCPVLIGLRNYLESLEVD